MIRNKIKSKQVVANSVYGDKKGRKFYHCLKCDIRYLYPRLSKKEESKFYKKEFERFMDSRRGKYKLVKYKKHIFQNKQTFKKIKILKPYLKPGLSILEIGCSRFMLFL